MKEFAGILFTLKKRVQNIVENDLQYYKLHIPQELRIRSRGTERHSASN